VQLYTGAQINFGDLTPYLTYVCCEGNAGEWSRKAERALADAKKDNDFIYHERIPDVKQLTPIGEFLPPPTP
jgi:hypothetical protein